MPWYLLEASVRHLSQTHDLCTEETLKTSELFGPDILVCTA